MKATLRTRTVTVFLCPHCGKGEHSAAHLPAGATFGPWYCRECGGSFSGVIGADGDISLALERERKVPTLDVLVLPPQAKPVYFVVEGMRFTGGRRTVDDEAESKRFFYESHSCPTNWLRPEMLYHDGDADPHGLIEFVRSVDADSVPPDEDHGPNDHDAALVRLIESAGAPPKGA